MSIIYPLIPPTTPKPRQATITTNNIVGVSTSPFTGEADVQEWPGEWLGLDVSLPPIRDRKTAEQWTSFLAALRGQSGTFVYGEPCALVAQVPDRVLLPTAGPFLAGSKILNIKGNVPGATIRAGDYVEVPVNYLNAAGNLADASWVNGGNIPYTLGSGLLAPDSSLDAFQVNFGATSGGEWSTFQQSNSAAHIQGQEVRLSVFLRAETPISVILGLYKGDGTVLSPDVWVNVTTDWRLFTVSAVIPADAPDGFVFKIYNPPDSPSKSVQVWAPSIYAPYLDAHLHKVLRDTTADANGFSVLDIYPRLRQTAPNFTPVLLANPVGKWRLKANHSSWQKDNAGFYSISFSAVEAL